MSDQFLAMDLKSGLSDVGDLLTELQWKITSYVDEAEVEAFLDSCPQYKKLLAMLDGLQGVITELWTPELEAIRQEERKELDRQEDLADAASY